MPATCPTGTSLASVPLKVSPPQPPDVHTMFDPKAKAAAAAAAAKEAKAAAKPKSPRVSRSFLRCRFPSVQQLGHLTWGCWTMWATKSMVYGVPAVVLTVCGARCAGQAGQRARPEEGRGGGGRDGAAAAAARDAAGDASGAGHRAAPELAAVR